MLPAFTLFVAAAPPSYREPTAHPNFPAGEPVALFLTDRSGRLHF